MSLYCRQPYLTLAYDEGAVAHVGVLVEHLLGRLPPPLEVAVEPGLGEVQLGLVPGAGDARRGHGGPAAEYHLIGKVFSSQI